MVMGHADISRANVLKAGGPKAGPYDMNNSNTWTDFPDLSLTFQLSESTAVMASFHISMFSDFSALVTRIMVDGDVVSKTITGENAFWDNSNLWMGILAPGQHTVKVQYRTPKGGHSHPDGSDLSDRTLQLMILGDTN